MCKHVDIKFVSTTHILIVDNDKHIPSPFPPLNSAAEDAREAAAAGAAGIIVSAHGGRPLDGVPAPV